MAKLIIHAGTGKTGTSAIQGALLTNREELARQGIYYIQSNQPQPHLAGKHKFRWRRRNHPDWDELREEAAELAKTADTVVVTNETLWKKNEEELQFFKDCFKGYQFSILLYVREQVEYLSSRALQAAKQESGRWKLEFKGQERPGNLDWFLDEFLKEVDYLAVARRWEGVFGKGSVQARLYARDVFSSGNVVEDFYEVIGASTDSLDLHVEANPSLSVPYAAILDGEGEFLSGDLEKRDLMEMALRLSQSKTHNPRKLIPASRAEEIRRNFEESNRLLFEDYVVNAAGFAKREYDEGNAYDLNELASDLESKVSAWPLISMLEKSVVEQKWFQEGWDLSERDCRVATQEGASAVIRFRLPFLKGFWLGAEDFGIVLTCGEESVLRTVSVNGHDFGAIDLATNPVPLPRSLLGQHDNVNIRISPPADGSGELAVIGLRFVAMKHTEL